MAGAQTLWRPSASRSNPNYDTRVEGISFTGAYIAGFESYDVASGGLHRPVRWSFGTSNLEIFKYLLTTGGSSGANGQHYSISLDGGQTSGRYIGPALTNGDWNAAEYIPSTTVSGTVDHFYINSPSDPAPRRTVLMAIDNAGTLLAGFTHPYSDVYPGAQYPGDSSGSSRTTHQAVLSLPGGTTNHVYKMFPNSTDFSEVWGMAPGKERLVGAYRFTVNSVLNIYPAYFTQSGTWSATRLQVPTDSGYFGGAAHDASVEGSVIVGWVQTPESSPRDRPFRWTNGTMVDLLVGTTYDSAGLGRAYAVDGFGETVVGFYKPDSQPGTQSKAFVKTPGKFYDLTSLLGNVSVTGYTLMDATGVTGDGSRICGNRKTDESITQPDPQVVWAYDPFVIAAPSSYSIGSGSLLSGSLSALAQPWFLETTTQEMKFFDNTSTLVTQVDFTGSLGNTSTTKELDLYAVTSQSRAGLGLSIQAYNYSSSSFVELFADEAPVGRLTKIFSLLNSAATPYIGSGGAVKVRLYSEPINDESPNQDGWLMSVDYIQWRQLK